MSFTFIMSIVITALIYSFFIGVYQLGRWMARNTIKKWVKVLDKILILTYHVLILITIWFFVKLVLNAIGFSGI